MKWRRILLKTTMFYVISIPLGLIIMQVIVAHQNQDFYGLLISINLKEYLQYFLFACLVCVITGFPIFIFFSIYFYYIEMERDRLEIAHKMIINGVFGFLVSSFWIQGMKLFYGDFPGAWAFALGSVIAGILIEINILPKNKKANLDS